MVTHKDYEFLNGMSNHFWGWGKEDDEFRERCVNLYLIL